MSDADLRALERRHAADPSDESAAALDRAQERAGRPRTLRDAAAADLARALDGAARAIANRHLLAATRDPAFQLAPGESPFRALVYVNGMSYAAAVYLPFPFVLTDEDIVYLEVVEGGGRTARRRRAVIPPLRFDGTDRPDDAAARATADSSRWQRSVLGEPFPDPRTPPHDGT